MAVSIVMPALEMSQETGKLLSWRKKEGETIIKGELLMEIETDKVVFELEAPEDGVLAGVCHQEGDVVPVGEIVAWIVAPGEEPPAETAKVQSGRAVTEAPRSREAASSASSSPAGVSPRARRLAQELGVDLATVTGTGPRGTVTSEDIQAAANSKSTAPAAPALSAVARVMAERTAQAWATVPHFFLTCDVDMTALLGLRETLTAPQRITVTDMLIAVVARTLRNHEKMNASWTGDTIRPNPTINISLAIAVNDGVIGPVIRDADKADIQAIATRRQDLVDRSKSNKLRPADVEGGTFTISNLGMYGIDSFHAIVTPPQAGILAVGRTEDRVVAIEGKPAIRPMMTITLSGDHRVVDGAQGASFLKDLVAAIGNPQF